MNVAMLMFLLALIDDPTDEEKFTRLYYGNCRQMLYIARSILREYDLAEDVIQDCFIYVASKIKFYDETKNVRAALCCLARNRAINKKKQVDKEIKTFDPTCFESIEDISVTIEDSVVSDIYTESVLKWIKTLPTIYSDIIILKYQCGYSEKEIAEVLDIPYPTVRKRAERVRNKVDIYLNRMEANK